ncbi:MAG: hypothetical protein JW882_06285 [Deltaproteobacteria bacterium]|nr:hypothetical protein [Deltaproteobacteria bacterium]
MEIRDIIYFDEPGPANSEKLLELAIRRTDELGIKRVVIASQAGVTAKKFLELTKDNRRHDILAVTNRKGGKLLVTTLYNKYEGSKKIREDYEEKGITHFQASINNDTREELEKEGVKVLYLSDVLNIGDPWGLDGKNLSRTDEEWKQRRAKLKPFIPGHLRPLDIEAGTDLSLLNIISMGFRVAVGVTASSVRYGLIPKGEIILSVAGTGFAGGGVDTAIIVEAHANAKACWIKEIIGFPKLK